MRSGFPKCHGSPLPSPVSSPLLTTEYRRNAIATETAVLAFDDKTRKLLAFGDKCAPRRIMQPGFMSPELKLRDAGAPTLQPITDRGVHDRIVRPLASPPASVLIPSGDLISSSRRASLDVADNAENIGIFLQRDKKKIYHSDCSTLEAPFTRSGRTLTS